MTAPDRAMFPFAETFKAPQGEGLFTGVQMLFARLVGCSVGQKVCTACDTDFSAVRGRDGGGHFSADDLAELAGPVRHVCLTGGEPLDRDIRPLVRGLLERGRAVHVETSGTRWPDWLDVGGIAPNASGKHAVAYLNSAGTAVSWRWEELWVTVSPKPGYRPEMVARADEVKVIVGGLGDGPGWPSVGDALAWAAQGKLVYLQPRHRRDSPDHFAMDEAVRLVAAHPELRLSAQLHKYLGTR